MLRLTILIVLLTSCSSAVPDTADRRTTEDRVSIPPAAPEPSPTARAPQVPPPVVVIDPGHNGGNAGAPEEINRPVPDGNGGTKPCNTVGTSTDAGYPEHAVVGTGEHHLESLRGKQVPYRKCDRPGEGIGPCVDQRAMIADQAGAAAFVSIHADGSAPGDRGFHVITSTLDPAGPAVAEASDGLAVSVRDAMSGVLPPSNYLGSNGLNPRDDLAGLNLNLRPAIYLECANMRNATDAALLSDPAGQAAIAAAIAQGIVGFLG